MSTSENVSHSQRTAELATEIERVLTLGSVEAVHHMRVAAGRLSVWLELGGRRVLRDDLRWLRGCAANVRDVDVMSSTPKPEAWRAHLEFRRHAALAATRAALTTTRPRALLVALSSMPELPRDEAERGLRRVTARAKRAGDSLDPDESAPEHLHRARRRFRRWRYALEWLGHDSDVAKSLQDAFGSLNDAVVERESWQRLPAHERSLVDPVDVEETSRRLDEEVDARRRAAYERWTTVRENWRDVSRAADRAEDRA